MCQYSVYYTTILGDTVVSKTLCLLCDEHKDDCEFIPLYLGYTHSRHCKVCDEVFEPEVVRVAMGPGSPKLMYKHHAVFIERLFRLNKNPAPKLLGNLPESLKNGASFTQPGIFDNDYMDFVLALIQSCKQYASKIHRSNKLNTSSVVNINSAR